MLTQIREAIWNLARSTERQGLVSTSKLDGIMQSIEQYSQEQFELGQAKGEQEGYNKRMAEEE